jgi:hypothetical protein
LREDYIKRKDSDLTMKKYSSIILLLSFISLYGEPAPVSDMNPVVVPFDPPVCNAFTLPLPNRVGIEILISSFERQFATISFTDHNILSVDSVPLDESKEGIKAVLGSQNGSDLVLLQNRVISILNRETNRITDEYSTALPQPDLLTEYFQGKMVTNSDNVLVIAEMQPSVGEEGILDPTLHSLVLENVKGRKTIKRIVFNHPLGESPPVFFSQDAIIYRNKRKDIAEPWKAVDNTLSPVNHPLCAILDSEFKQSLLWGMVISEQHKHAVIYSRAVNTKMPAITYVSWQTNRVAPVTMPTGILANQKNLMISPSGKWVFFTAITDDENKRSVDHTLLNLDPSSENGYLPPRIIAAGKLEDRAAWMSDPERLVVFCQGQVMVWDLSKFEVKKQVEEKKAKVKAGKKKGR